jgi:4'-phosphopantetheinyl transferase
VTPGPPPPGEVHVHLARLPGDLEHATWLLSAGERARASRFRFDRDRRRFVAAHALLRSVVASYAGVDPPAVRIDQTCDRCGAQHGPPRIPRGAPGDGLAVSLSRSGELAGCAVASGGAVGLDVERLRLDLNVAALASSTLTPGERERVAQLDGDAARAAVLACWTRKEAYTKGLGEGLRVPFDSFAVAPGPDGTVRVLPVGGADAEAARWSIRDLALPGYAGAVAYRGAPLSVVSRWRTRVEGGPG